MRTYLVRTAIAVFLVLFNAGYVFHDLLLGDWFHHHEAGIARDELIIPLIALAFAVYALVLTYLFPMFRQGHARRPLLTTALGFGILMGIVFDALQGGIIEYATMRLPFAVFAVDTAYHVLVEGPLAGLVLAVAYRRWWPQHRPGRVASSLAATVPATM